MASDLLSRYAGHDAQTIAALAHYEYLYKLSSIITFRWDIVGCKHCEHLVERLKDLFSCTQSD